MIEVLGSAKRTNRTVSQVAVVATAMIFGLTYSLSAPLIALEMSDRGLGESMIGANAAMHAVGVLIVAPILPRLVARVGARQLVLAALALAAVTLAAFPMMPSVWLWFPLRLVLGMASEVLFVLSETWINHLATERTRARWMAVYTGAQSIGFALGPLILASVGTQGSTPFMVGAGVALIAVVFVASPRVEAPVFEEPTVSNPLRYLRLAPIAIATTVLYAALETSGLSFLPLYAMSEGWAEADATTLISSLMFGAIVLALPIGWLGDMMDRRALVLILGLVAAVGALLWPLVLQDPWLAYPLVFVWGGAFVGIYTLMLTVVGSRFKGADLVGIYAVMGLTWGAGALVGPTLAGFSMDHLPHGLAIFASAACFAFVLYLLFNKSDA